MAHDALVRQQPTALEHTLDSRLLELRSLLEQRGLPVQQLANMDGWLVYQAALISSICVALYRCRACATHERSRAILTLMCLPMI